MLPRVLPNGINFRNPAGIPVDCNSSNALGNFLRSFDLLNFWGLQRNKKRKKKKRRWTCGDLSVVKPKQKQASYRQRIHKLFFPWGPIPPFPPFWPSGAPSGLSKSVWDESWVSPQGFFQLSNRRFRGLREKKGYVTQAGVCEPLLVGSRVPIWSPKILANLSCPFFFSVIFFVFVFSLFFFFFTPLLFLSIFRKPWM